jgi:hypothetical protein
MYIELPDNEHFRLSTRHIWVQEDSQMVFPFPDLDKAVRQNPRLFERMHYGLFDNASFLVDKTQEIVIIITRPFVFER